MATAIYKGFSTDNWLNRRTFGLSNVALVERDLLTQIWTNKGDRVMMPDFGTRIPMLAFEPNDDNTRAIIDEDLRAVFNYDPRVQLLSLNIMSLPSNNAIIAIAELLYIEFNVTQVLNIEIPTQ
jgi:phage baseplate assembly protein W